MTTLNARQQKIVRLLLSTSNTTAAELATQVGVSRKTVYSDLREIVLALRDDQVTITVTPRKGITVTAKDADIQNILRKLKSEKTKLPDSDRSRERYILSELLRSQDYISIDQLAEVLFISRRVIQRNLDNLNRQLIGTDTELLRIPGRGVRIEGEEGKKRKVLFKMLSQYWDSDWRMDQSSEGWTADPAIAENPNIDSSVVNILARVVQNASEKVGLSLSEYAIQSLVIHLAIAINRIKAGNPIGQNDDLIRNIGNERKSEAVQLAAMVEKEVNVRLPDEEIAYIQIHLIAASANQVSLANQHSMIPIPERLKELLHPFGYDRDLLFGLTVHMQAAVKRLRVNAGISNPYTEDIKRNYPQAFDEALIVSDDYERTEHISMNDDEVAYVALHIEAYLERRRAIHQRVNAAIVCSTGLGSAQLLAARIRREFSDISIVKIWSLQDFQRNSLVGIDLIISTLRLPKGDIPTVTVSPVMSDSDALLVRNLVRNIEDKKNNKHAEFFRIIHGDLMWLASNARSWKEVIQNLGDRLEQQGYADEGLTASALERENLSFTSFDNYAIPHAQPELVQAPAIAICTLEHPINWGHHKVSVVFFLAMTKKMNQQQIDSIFDDLYDIVADTNLLNALTKATDKKELIEILKRGIE